MLLKYMRMGGVTEGKLPENPAGSNAKSYSNAPGQIISMDCIPGLTGSSRLDNAILVDVTDSQNSHIISLLQRRQIL